MVRKVKEGSSQDGSNDRQPHSNCLGCDGTDMRIIEAGE